MKLFLRSIYYALPPAMRLFIRRIWYWPADFYDRITGKTTEMVPPRGINFTGSGDFVDQGNKFLQYFITLGGLKPEMKVLDVGCGFGRMARPLTTYLNESGSYNGFDIMKEGIEWCQKEISSRYNNFKFTHTQLKNSLYTYQGETADEFIFPYDSDTFDFVILTSVFTHLKPADTRQYLQQINRVLKPGGTCFATFFYYDTSAKNNDQQRNPSFFHAENDGFALHNPAVPEANIAFTPQLLQSFLNYTNLSISEIYPGWWSGRPKAQSTDFQDILIFSKA